MSYEWDFTWVVRNLDVLLKGLGVTFSLTILSVSSGFVIAIPLVLLRNSRNLFLSLASRLFIETFRALPVLVVLVWLFYCLPGFLGSAFRLEAFTVAVIGLSLNFSALQAEILRSGYQAIPHGAIEAARAFSFSPWQLAKHIIIPQAIWRSIAPTLGQAINTLKLSSLASFISVHEVFLQTTQLIQEYSRPMEFYTSLAVLYLLTILPLSFALQRLETNLNRRFSRHASST